MASSDLVKQAQLCQRKCGALGISVFIAEVQQLEELVAQAPPLIAALPRLSVCSFAALGNFHIVPTFKAPHFTILLADVEEATLEQLRDCFLAMPNPFGGT